VRKILLDQSAGPCILSVVSIWSWRTAMKTRSGAFGQEPESVARVQGKKAWNSPHLSTWEVSEETLTNGSSSGPPPKYEWVMDREKGDEVEKKD